MRKSCIKTDDKGRFSEKNVSSSTSHWYIDKGHVVEALDAV